MIDGGALLPLGSERDRGGHKGYALALAVDVLCAVLSGANWGPFTPPFALRQESPRARVGKGIGHFFGAMRIDGFVDVDEFKRQIDDLIRTFRATRPAPGTSGPLLPGDPEREARRCAACAASRSSSPSSTTCATSPRARGSLSTDHDFRPNHSPASTCNSTSASPAPRCSRSPPSLAPSSASPASPSPRTRGRDPGRAHAVVARGALRHVHPLGSVRDPGRHRGTRHRPRGVDPRDRRTSRSRSTSSSSSSSTRPTFDADQWVRFAKAAGMQYLVVTSKHHDGFCMWDSSLTEWDVMDTPFKRDVLKELSEACSARGIRFCTYHSIMDWHHPDYLPRRGWETRRPTARTSTATRTTCTRR
jgi:hypothetical protein